MIILIMIMILLGPRAARVPHQRRRAHGLRVRREPLRQDQGPHHGHACQQQIKQQITHTETHKAINNKHMIDKQHN